MPSRNSRARSALLVIARKQIRRYRGYSRLPCDRQNARCPIQTAVPMLGLKPHTALLRYGVFQNGRGIARRHGLSSATLAAFRLSDPQQQRSYFRFRKMVDEKLDLTLQATVVDVRCIRASAIVDQFIQIF